MLILLVQGVFGVGNEDSSVKFKAEKNLWFIISLKVGLDFGFLFIN